MSFNYQSQHPDNYKTDDIITVVLFPSAKNLHKSFGPYYCQRYPHSYVRAAENEAVHAALQYTSKGARVTHVS
jgi:hypothetical protein